MSKQDKRKSSILLIALLLGVLAVLLVIYFLTNNFSVRYETKDEEDLSISSFADFSTDDVDTFNYDYEDTLQTFTREGEDWIYANDKTIDLDEDLVDSMLSVLTDLECERVVADNLSSTADYGLEDPEMTITLSLSDGTQKILYIGSQNPITSAYYAFVEGEDNIYLLSSNIPQAFVSVTELEAEDADSEESTEETTEDTAEETAEDTANETTASGE